MKVQKINTDPTIEQKPEDLSLWQPFQELTKEANLTLYQTWLEREKGLHFNSPFELWDWSVNNLADFWGSIWDYFEVKASQPYTSVLLENKMPGARWFCGAKLNYAEHIFRNATDTRPAIKYASEGQPIREVSWNELQSKTAAIAAALRQLGVKPGDRVVAYLPNIPETIITFLACASIGAIWSCCGPDFGITSVIDRFQQIKPKILFAVDGYRYNGKEIDRRSVLAQLQAQLPELEYTVLVSHLYLDSNPDANVPASGVIHAGPPADVALNLKDTTLSWFQLLEMGHSLAEGLTFEQVEFDHPLWILYSSGTTGLPKAIVQGHGGILLEGLKASYLCLNLKSSDVYSWYTTTSWVMWNLQVNVLLTGATIFIYTGPPH
jgi:acetoacetyl-CoA synthetase